MNKLLTIGSLGIAGLFTAGVVATAAPTAFAHGGDDSSSVVRTADDRGRDHAEDGPHHGGRHHEARDDHGRHHHGGRHHEAGDDHGRHHDGGDDHGGHGHGSDD